MSDTKFCVKKSDGSFECIDIMSEIKKGMSRPKKILIGIAFVFVAIFAVVTIMSWLAGSLGFDVISGLILSAWIIFIPVSFALVVWLIFLLIGALDLDTTTKTIVVVILIVAIIIGLFFLYSWVVAQITTLWGSMVSSW